MPDLKFIVTIKDYEPGISIPDEQIGSDLIERAVTQLLDEDGSDGTVIVEDQSGGGS